jgi:putative transposase
VLSRVAKFMLAETMSPAERKTIINRNRSDLSLTKQCKLLKISRSSLYVTPVGVKSVTLKLMNESSRDLAARCTIR